MSLRDKYDEALQLIRDYALSGIDVREENDVLKVKATVQTEYEKDVIWSKVKEVGGNPPKNFMADIQVQKSDHYHMHTVQKGETLSRLANRYYADPNRHQTIFDANRGLVKDPDLLSEGQRLVIPKLTSVRFS